MPGPTFTLGFIIATLMVTVTHMLVGGEARRLALLLLAGWLGFSIGHILGNLFEITVFDIGQLHLVSGLVGGAVALFAAVTLTMRSRRLGTRRGRKPVSRQPNRYQ